MYQLECEDTECSTHEPRFKQGATSDSGSEVCNEITTASLNLRLSKVRDYRDRFILRQLQEMARKENPGFLFLIEGREKAKVIWVEKDGRRVPAGYYVFCEPRREFSRYAHGHVPFPMTLSQLFVCEEFRRRGVATRMVQDFIHHSSLDAIWVESPKAETKALLNKLGYFEPNVPYELWQMMEGLSRWMRIEEVVIRAKLVSASAEELRVWCGDTYMVLEDLR